MNLQSMVMDLKRSGLTQKQIANGSGTSQSTISRILRGLITDCSHEAGMKISFMHRQRFPLVYEDREAKLKRALVVAQGNLEEATVYNAQLREALAKHRQGCWWCRLKSYFRGE